MKGKTTPVNKRAPRKKMKIQAASSAIETEKDDFPEKTQSQRITKRLEELTEESRDLLELACKNKYLISRGLKAKVDLTTKKSRSRININYHIQLSIPSGVL